MVGIRVICIFRVSFYWRWMVVLEFLEGKIYIPHCKLAFEKSQSLLLDATSYGMRSGGRKTFERFNALHSSTLL